MSSPSKAILKAKRSAPALLRGGTSQQIPDGDKTLPVRPASRQTTLQNRGTPLLHLSHGIDVSTRNFLSSGAASLPSKFSFNSKTKVLTRLTPFSGNNSFNCRTQPLLPSPPLSLATINFLDFYFASLHSSSLHSSFVPCNTLVQKLVDSLFVRAAPTSPPSTPDWIRVFSKKEKNSLRALTKFDYKGFISHKLYLLKKTGKCFKCFNSGHRSISCTSQQKCWGCGKSGHALLKCHLLSDEQSSPFLGNDHLVENQSSLLGNEPSPVTNPVPPSIPTCHLDTINLPSPNPDAPSSSTEPIYPLFSILSLSFLSTSILILLLLLLNLLYPLPPF